MVQRVSYPVWAWNYKTYRRTVCGRFARRKVFVQVVEPAYVFIHTACDGSCFSGGNPVRCVSGAQLRRLQLYRHRFHHADHGGGHGPGPSGQRPPENSARFSQNSREDEKKPLKCLVVTRNMHNFATRNVFYRC